MAAEVHRDHDQGQGKGESCDSHVAEETPSKKFKSVNFADRESASEETFRSDSSCCLALVPRRVSSWVAGGPAFGFDRDDHIHNKDILQYIPITIQEDELLFKTLYSLSAGNPKMPFAKTLTPSQTKILKEVHDAITVNIQQSKFSGPAEEGSRDHMRRLLGHGAWPDMVPTGSYRVALEDMQESLTQILHLQELEMFSTEADRLHRLSVLKEAERFLHEIHTYLHIQPKMRENGLACLFSSFASVAELKFSPGTSISPRHMKIFGKDVSAEPDLRAYAREGWMYVDAASCPRAELKVAALVEVKAEPPKPIVDDLWMNSLGPKLIGQMIGEMILEMPHSATADYICSFFVQSSMVRFCLLHLPGKVQEFLKSVPGRKFIPYQGPGQKGQMYFSMPMDMLIQKDRLKLWQLMQRIVNTTAQ